MLSLASDFRFACPYCSQHLACPVGYSGHHVQCPNCANTLVIPRPSVPAPRVPCPGPASTAPTPGRSAWEIFAAGLSILDGLKLLVTPAMMLGPPFLAYFFRHHPQIWLASTLENWAFLVAWLSPLGASLLLALSVESTWAKLALFVIFCPVFYFAEFFIVVVAAFLNTPVK